MKGDLRALLLQLVQSWALEGSLPDSALDGVSERLAEFLGTSVEELDLDRLATDEALAKIGIEFEETFDGEFAFVVPASWDSVRRSPVRAIISQGDDPRQTILLWTLGLEGWGEDFEAFLGEAPVEAFLFRRRLDDLYLQWVWVLGPHGDRPWAIYSISSSGEYLITTNTLAETPEELRTLLVCALESSPWEGWIEAVQRSRGGGRSRPQPEDRPRVDRNALLLDRLVLKPRRAEFDLERIHRKLSGMKAALPDPHLEDVVLLIAPSKRARRAVLEAREQEPQRMPCVGIVELSPGQIVLHQNTTGPGLAACQRFLTWMSDKRRCRIYDELGRRLELDDGVLKRRHPKTRMPALDASVTAAGPAEAALMSHLPVRAESGRGAPEGGQVTGIPMVCPVQDAHVHVYDDGTVVRLFPKGFLYEPGPSYQVGVLKESAKRYRGPEDIAFFVDNDGDPVPCHLSQMAETPYPPDEAQDLILKRTVFMAGTRRTRDEDQEPS